MRRHTYWPSIKVQGEKLDWQYKNGFLVGNDQLGFVVNESAFHLRKALMARKAQAFLSKKFIVIDKALEAVVLIVDL